MLITGVVSNWADSIPGFILSGQEPSTYLDIHKNLRMYGTQGFSAYEMVKNVTKYSNVLLNPNSIQTELETLYNIRCNRKTRTNLVRYSFRFSSKES